MSAEMALLASSSTMLCALRPEMRMRSWGSQVGSREDLRPAASQVRVVRHKKKRNVMPVLMLVLKLSSAICFVACQESHKVEAPVLLTTRPWPRQQCWRG